MDTCTNCGASLRPGAKFCTTCGTRLNEMPPASTDGWGTPRTSAPDDTQETSVIRSVQSQESSAFSKPDQSSADSWSSAFSSSSTSNDDPASRFISALDNDVQPAENPEAVPDDPPESTWDVPAPVFIPPRRSDWSYSFEPAESTNAESGDTDQSETTWETPSTWAVIEESDDDTADEVDSAGFADHGDDEVNYLSGDENLELSGVATPTLTPDEARDKAIALADELRRTIRMMGSGGESDHGAAVMALTEASLHVGDFSDVRGVLAEVSNDPRNIETLGSLAAKVERLETLLDEHKALADAIETAISELNG